LTGRLSIGARLATGYTLSAFGLLACVTAFQYWILTQGLEWDETQIVLDKVRMFEATLRRHGDNEAFLDHEVNLEGGAYWPGQQYVVYSRILDETGHVIIETPGMQELIPASSFPQPVEAGRDESPGLVHYGKAPNGRSYFLLSGMARSGGKDGPRRLIQVAMDETGERAMIARYRRDTLFALFLGTLLFGIAGTFIARRCLRPVQDLARTAERITANSALAGVELDTVRWPAELTTLADSFYRMLSRLTDSLQRCSQCAEDIAHELRNPIHTLRGGAEVALSKARTAEEYRQVLETSLEEYERLSRMINELLFIARADNPDTAIERVALDVRSELEAVRDFHEAQAQEQGVTLSCTGQARLDADPLLLRRAVSNLVSNALSHTPAGGRVSLEVRDAARDDLVEIAVRDTGGGIGAEDLPRIFERYFRLAGERRRLADGAGLGLAIVKSIMTLHGGSATVESTPGEGTAILLRFPAPGPCAGEQAPLVPPVLPARPAQDL
jgi:two-component system heavy metal sensor histidine kinase CusS